LRISPDNRKKLTFSSFPDESLDWEYSENLNIVPVDIYEETRCTIRRNKDALRLSAYDRHCILMEKWDYSISSIMQASRDTDFARNKRLRTARKSMSLLRKKNILSSTFKPLKDFFKNLNISRKGKRRKAPSSSTSSESMVDQNLCSSETGSVSSVEEVVLEKP
jgi:hypothetical protein